MLKIRYAKNTYGPKCQNTHGPKLWLLDTWAWAHGPGRMGRRRPAAAAGPPPPPPWYLTFPSGGGVHTIILAAVSRQDLRHVSENEGFRFGNLTTHWGTSAISLSTNGHN